MISMYLKLVISFITVSLFVGCASSAPEMSFAQKRQIEQKIIHAPFKSVYQSALVVLQDNGYSIENMEQESGFILATRNTNKTANDSVNDFVGSIFNSEHINVTGYKHEISIIISHITNNQTKVRYKMTRFKVGDYDTRKDVREIVDPNISQAFYSALIAESERNKKGFL